MALTAVMTTLAACSQDDELMDAAPKQAQIEFEITDGGYGGDEATRAKEEGFRTKFEAGDVCGLYIVRDGSLIAKNVILTAEEGENGIIWKAADGAISGAAEGDKYFLCYPPVVEAEDKVNPSATDSDDTFFARIISGWNTLPNQNDYAYYRYNDLMTATGTATTGADGKLKVSFSMKHRMALAVIELPKTVYKFEGTSIPDYTVALSADFSGSDYKPLRMEDGTYRFVFNPELTNIKSITGIINGNKKFTITATNLGGIEKGTYKTFRIGGADATKVKNHTLQVGDYLLKDGNLISKGEPLSESQKANVAAIVFWAGDATAKDKTLKADHSGCTHGLAVAVKGDEETQWQSAEVSVQEWLNANRSGVYLNVQTEGIGLQHQVNNIQGYNNTKAIEDYNNANADSKVLAVEKIVGYRASNPAPANSSNWYLPSAKELSIICGEDVTVNIWGKGKEVGTDNRNVINTILQNVDGATQLGTTTLYYYLSSTEYDGTRVVDVKFSNGFVTNEGKSYSKHVRPVLAF